MSDTKLQELKNKLKQKEKELKILFTVAQTISGLDLDPILSTIVSIVSRVTKADSCFIYIIDSKKEELILRASKNPHKTALGRITMKIGEGITGWVAREKKPVVINQKASTDSRFKLFPSLAEDRYEAFFSVPILNKHGVVGVINAQYKKKHIHTVGEVELLSAIGQLVGGAVENARLVEESLTLKEALETRKVIDKAKGILMKKLQLSEDEAYRKIQKQSMNMRKSARDIAEAIVVSEVLTHS